MPRSKRQLGLLLGTALSLVMVGACAQTGGFFSSQSDASASLVDHALNSARLARQSGDLDTASRRLAYLVSIAPDNAEVLGEYGKVLTEMGRPDDGIAYLNKALARDPGNWKLYNAVAVAYDERHDYASSSAAYDKALSLAPGNSAILANDARSRILAGDTQGARQLLAQANPSETSGVYFSGLEAQLAAAEAAKHSDTAEASAAPAQLPAATPQAGSGETEAKYRVGEIITPAPSTPVTVTVDARQRTNAPTATAVAAASAPAPVLVSSSQSVSTPDIAPTATPAPVPAPKQKPAVAEASAVAPEPAKPPAAAPSVDVTALATPAEPAAPTVATNNASESSKLAAMPVSAPAEIKPVVIEAPIVPAASSAPAPVEVKAASVAVQPAAQPTIAMPRAAKTNAPVPTPVEASKPVVTIVASQNAPAPEAPAAPVVAAAAAEAPPAPQEAPGAPARAPVVATPVAVVATSVPSTDTSVELAATVPATPDKHYFIRVGTWHSRKHARHVAAKLRPRDVHIARVNYHGRRYYRVWMAASSQAEETLASVRSLGFMHARIIAKVDSPTARKIAANKASGQLAFDFMHQS
jgi:Flp pilus assembly protein TadD